MDLSKEIPKFTFTRPDPNLNENRVPRSIETSLLQQLILSRRRYLAAIDDEITVTTSLTEELQGEIVELEAKMDEKRSMLALLNNALAASNENRHKVLKDIMSLSNVIPVARRLPDEVLVQIFSYAVEMEEAERRSLALEWRSYSLGRVPLTIAGVCRRWRYMVLGMPEMWRFVNVVSWEDDSARMPPALEMWCRYGDPEIREISIDGWRKHHYSPLPAILQATKTRNRSILSRIEVSCIDDYTDLNNDWPFVYPLAKETVLISHGTQGICDFFIPLVTRAEKLVLSGVKPWWSEAIWDSLVDLTIVGIPNTRLPGLRASEILEMMTMIPSLKRLDMQWDQQRSEGAEPKGGMPTLIHGELKSLACPFESIETYISPFQEAIICPALETITLKTLPFVTPPMMRGWTTFFNNVTPYPLQKLVLPSIQTDSIDHLLALFRLLSSLSHLDLTGPAVDQLIQRLTADTTASHFVHLSSLKVVDVKNANLTDATLEQFVKSRRSSAAAAKGILRVEKVSVYE